MMICAAVMLLVLITPMGDYIEVPDRATVTRVGIITGKEHKDENLIVYIKVPDKGYSLQLYMADSDNEPLIGTVIKVRGKTFAFPAATNYGEFDSRKYYRTLKIAYRITDAKVLETAGKEDSLKEFLYRERERFGKKLDAFFSKEDAGIMKAVLLGDKGGLSADIKDLYKRGGIIHILSVSGLHISLIGMALYKLLRKGSLWVLPSAIISMIIMFLYGIMCGMGTSAFRAIVMFVIKLAADVIGRSYDMLSAMSLSGIMLILDQPLYITHSGFLMSYGAIIAIGYVLPAFPEVIRQGKLKIVSGSLAISLATFPVYINTYYTFPVYSMVLNLLVLPLVALLMLSGFLVILLGSISLSLGFILSMPAHVILIWYRFCCNISGSIPGNTWYVGHANVVQTIAYLIFLVLFCVIGMYNREGEKSRSERLERMRVLLLGLGIVIASFRLTPELKITILDVGQGDGIVIESKEGNYLVDGGSTSKKNVGKYQIIPYLSYEGIGSLDAVIVTHEDEDHVSGIIEMMEEMAKSGGAIRIKNLILPDISESSKGDNYKKLERYAGLLDIPVSYIGRGSVISNKNLYIKCLGPVPKMSTDEPNAYSTVLYLECDLFKGILTGDVDGEGQENLRSFLAGSSSKYRDITFLKVSHHGSRFTTDSSFLSIVKPKIAGISCGKDNRYGHPHKEVLDRLKKVDSNVLRTDKCGAFSLEVKGDSLKLRKYLEE